MPKKSGASDPLALRHSVTLGFKGGLWEAANAVRGSMDAAKYEHLVLGLVFLKYISDAFTGPHASLEGEKKQGADPKLPDAYRAAKVFWVPPEARWERLWQNARQSIIDQLVDQVMEAIARDNPSLKGVLPKDYARPALDKARLGQLIDLVSNITVGNGGAQWRAVREL